jgi:hypothetical protein
VHGDRDGAAAVILTQLNPPLPMYVASRRATGVAHAVIDYGYEHNLQWVIAMDETGEIWNVPNPDVRMQWNWSAGRPKRVGFVESQ